MTRCCFGRKFFLVISIPVAALLAATALAQREYKSGKVWPEPKAIEPGKTDDAPPADAIVLFDGKDLSKWEGGERWRGPGHNAVIFTDDAAFNVYHSYDADDGGSATLRISELLWDGDGWPISGGP